MDTNLKTKTVHNRDLGTVVVAQLHDIVFIFIDSSIWSDQSIKI